MLNCAKARIQTQEDNALPALSYEIPVSMTDVLRAQSKLTTFYTVSGPDKFSGITWIEYLNNEDVLKDILSQLEEMNFHCAQYLWLTHQADLECKFDEKMLEDLLNVIPANIPTHDLCSWFKNILIPFVRRLVPKAQKIIAGWLEHRARGLELTDKVNWPENGLEMAEVYFISKNPGAHGTAPCLLIPLKEDGDCEEVRQLMKLVNNLQALVNLYRKYNCKLTLSDFEKETTSTIVFRMLDKVLAPELIPCTLEQVIRPYMLQHSLQEEELLLHYIKDLLERSSSRSVSVFQTAWEAKAMAIMGCMTDADLIFDAVLIMSSAAAPWSVAVEQLVKRHLEVAHPKAVLLRESYRLMEMNTLLRSYGIRDFNLANDKQIMGLAKYILKQDSPTSLEDALKIVKAYLLPTGEVYIQRIVQLIYMNRGDECLQLLESLSPADIVTTVERFSLWARIVLKNNPGNSEECKEQKLITKTLVESLKFQMCVQMENPLQTVMCETNLRMFKAISNLQEHFDIFISPEEYETRSLVSWLIDEHIEAYEGTRSKSKSEKGPELNPSSDENPRTPFTEFRLYRLARLLQVTEQELEAKLALRALDVGKVGKCLGICRDLYEHHSNPQTGHLLFLVSQKLCQMLQENLPMVIPPGMNLPAVTYELSCQAVTICSPEGGTFGADKGPYKDLFGEDFFSEDGIVLDPLVVLPVAYDVATALVPSTAGKKMYPLDCASLAHCSYTKGGNMLLPAQTPVTILLETLQESSQCELTLRLAIEAFGAGFQHVASNYIDKCFSVKWHDEKGELHDELTETDAFVRAFGEKTKTIIKDTVIALLHKIFNCRVVDCNLALGYYTLLSENKVFEKLWDIINHTWQNYKKVLAAAVVGAQLAMLYNEEEERKKFEELITDAEWGIQLSYLGISFQSAFRQCSSRKKEIIRLLVQNPKVDKELILKYCSVFMLDSDAALLLYIEALLLSGSSWQHGEGDAIVDTVHQPQSVTKAKEILPLLKSTQDVVIRLTAILYKLGPYDYETIEGVLQIILEADELNTNIPLNQALGLVKHLKSYKRTAPPTDLEHEYILEHGIVMSPAAQTRLPFHLLFTTGKSFWGIISAEISEESLPTLLLISKLMKVSLDTLYMTAAKQVYEKGLKPKMLKQKTECSSQFSKETAKTVIAIQSYLQSIKNPEWAAAMSHRFAQELPTGPDKLSSLQFCLHLAEKWKQSTSPTEESHKKADLFIKKLSVQYRRSATENVLITTKLNNAQYLDKIGTPANLVVSLYEHSSVAQRIRDPTGRDYPDIHAAAKQISKLNNLNMNKICDVLLEKWLCASPPPPTDQNHDIFGDTQDDEDLERVVYLLQPYPVDYSSRMLYLIATSATSPIGNNQLTFAHRSRALRCLIHLADTETIVALVKKPIDQVIYYLKCCIYLSEIEILNIPYTFESFQRSPKEGMIKGLWKNHSHEPRTVRLITELALEYKVYDPQLWNGLLQKLLGFNMMHYLRKVLVAIIGVYCLWEIPNFSRTWRSVILAPLLSASCPPSPSQLEACYECFVALLKCPVMADLDLVGIAEQYAQIDLPAFTLGCLLLIPQVERREQQIQQVVAEMDTGEVAGFSFQIRNLILDSIFEKKQYDMFVKTKYFTVLKMQVMKTNHVRELAEYLLHRDCLDDAADLVREFLKRNGKPFPRRAHCLDIVKAFINGDP
ncbi:hypothetical protein FKM82_005052 [Ascaphus truei]